MIPARLLALAAATDRALTIAATLGGAALLVVGAARIYGPAGYLVAGALLLAQGVRSAR